MGHFCLHLDEQRESTDIPLPVSFPPVAGPNLGYIVEPPEWFKNTFA